MRVKAPTPYRRLPGSAGGGKSSPHAGRTETAENGEGSLSDCDGQRPVCENPRGNCRRRFAHISGRPRLFTDGERTIRLPRERVVVRRRAVSRGRRSVGEFRYGDPWNPCHVPDDTRGEVRHE
ncbi:hypothetical protein GCM10010361_08330 [Streptomyces olivaceiscleroticus]|uniref:Uncharacterized protein n=1 Tax=Streptomyces olivaceiscleroticus TaxID=68245 RepID=A0ABP3JD76_9ACTN